MPDTKTGFERLWRGCDNLLLLTVAVLLAVWFASSRQSDVALLKAEDVATDVGKEPPHRLAARTFQPGERLRACACHSSRPA